MKVQFNQDIILDGNRKVAHALDTAEILSNDGTNIHVKLDFPVLADVPEVVVDKTCVWTTEVKSEAAMSLDANVHQRIDGRWPPKPKTTSPVEAQFRIRTIGIKDIDLTEYQTFKQECQTLDGVTVPIAIAKALEAANISGKLMEYRALLLYTATELERQTKLQYAKAFGEAAGSNKETREANAKQDSAYQELLTRAAEVAALKQLVDDSYEHANKLHYFFKVVYQGESRVPMDSPFRG